MGELRRRVALLKTGLLWFLYSYPLLLVLTLGDGFSITGMSLFLLSLSPK